MIGTTSLQGTKAVFPRCPYLGGSTVYPALSVYGTNIFVSSAMQHSLCDILHCNIVERAEVAVDTVLCAMAFMA